jgi:hypothetical protein
MELQLLKGVLRKDFNGLSCVSTISKVAIDPISNVATTHSAIHNPSQGNLANQLGVMPDRKGK